MAKKLKRMIAAASTVAILGACGVGGWMLYSGSVTEQGVEEQQSKMRGQWGERPSGTQGGDFAADFGGMGDVVSASGTTSVGIDAVSFEIDFLEESQLVVEEVYLNSGDMVEAGQKYLKLTQESVEEARAELEETLLNADLSYRSGAITTKSSMIQAEYSYEEAMQTANYAKQVYEETLSSLTSDLKKAQITHDEAVAELDELNNAIVNNTFYEDYQIAKLKEAYDLAYDLYETKRASWGIDESELSSKSSSFSAGSTVSNSNQDSGSTDFGADMDMPSGDMSDTVMPLNEDIEEAVAAVITNSVSTGSKMNSNAERQQQIKTLNLLKEEAEENEDAYEQALEEYEEALEKAEINLRLLQNEVKSAKESLVEAQVKYEKQALSAKTTYETALVKGQTAKDEYDTELTSLQESLDKLLDAKEEAEENLALFEELVGDGYLYTKSAGTVLRVMAREEEALSGGSMIMAYSNQEEVTISVSVPQDSIASLTVGEEVAVMISDTESGVYDGKVTMINPVASSDSRTSVYYTVEVTLTGDLSGLSSNLTATVLFGMDSASVQQMMKGAGSRTTMENMPEREEMPDMGEMPDMENMPDMSNMPDFGEMPDFEKSRDLGGRNGQGGTVNE